MLYYKTDASRLLKGICMRRLLYTGDIPYEEYLKQLYKIDDSIKNNYIPNLKHTFLALQPNIKWGPTKKLLTNPYLQLEELISLIETIPNLFVKDKIIVSTTSINTKTIFGKGKMEELTQKIKSDPDITGVVVGVSALKNLQRVALENIWGKPVFDRYNIVIQIFKLFAKTKDAKLQIELAEIPYLKSRLNQSKSQEHLIHNFQYDLSCEVTPNDWDDYKTTKDCTPWHERIEKLNFKEDKLKRELEKLKNIKAQKRLVTNKSLPNPYPIIAIVGYTNSGKTSLIKALTGDKDIHPENRLFATLDVSLHQGTLPYMEKVLYLDTIGFISDIPTALISAFQTTLQDINAADILIHIRDCSHPDVEVQNATVKETLNLLDLKKDLVEDMLEVYNKIDLLPKLKYYCPIFLITSFTFSMICRDLLDKICGLKNVCLISIKKCQGLDELAQKIHKLVLSKRNKQNLNLKIPMQHYSKILGFLFKMNASIQSTLPSEDSQNMMLKAIVDNATLSIYKHKFGTIYFD